MGYFRVTPFFYFYSEIRVTRGLIWHSDFTKFSYRWGAYDTSSPFPTHLDAFGVSQQWVLVVFIFEQDVVGISAVMRVVFYRCLGIHIMRQRAMYENMTSSTKPEVHNVSHNASRGEPSQGHMQHAQIFGEVRPVVFESCKRTTKQTYSSQYFAPLRFYGAPCVFLSSDGTQMHDNQLYWITAHGGCLHSLWKDLEYMFLSILKSFHWKFFNQFAGERIFKLGEHLAK